MTCTASCYDHDEGVPCDETSPECAECTPSPSRRRPIDVKCFEDRLPCAQPAGTSEDRGGSNVAGEEFNDLESIILVLGATGKETLVPTEHLEREALSEAGTGAQV